MRCHIRRCVDMRSSLTIKSRREAGRTPAGTPQWCRRNNKRPRAHCRRQTSVRPVGALTATPRDDPGCAGGRPAGLVWGGAEPVTSASLDGLLAE